MCQPHDFAHFVRKNHCTEVSVLRFSTPAWCLDPGNFRGERVISKDRHPPLFHWLEVEWNLIERCRNQRGVVDLYDEFAIFDSEIDHTLFHASGQFLLVVQPFSNRLWNVVRSHSYLDRIGRNLITHLSSPLPMVSYDHPAKSPLVWCHWCLWPSRSKDLRCIGWWPCLSCLSLYASY